MKPVDQTIFGAPDGNCFQAAVASILEYSLDEVPHFCADGNERWAFAFEAWLRSHIGMYPLWVKVGHGWVPGGINILSGKSPRGDFQHSVVAYGERIIHDPHPSRAGLIGRQDVILFVPLDPNSLRLSVDRVDGCASPR